MTVCPNNQVMVNQKPLSAAKPLQQDNSFAVIFRLYFKSHCQTRINYLQANKKKQEEMT